MHTWRAAARVAGTGIPYVTVRASVCDADCTACVALPGSRPQAVTNLITANATASAATGIITAVAEGDVRGAAAALLSAAAGGRAASQAVASTTVQVATQNVEVGGLPREH